MFSKFIKKKPVAPAVIPEPPREIIVAPAWESRLQAALGNDTELLALAIEAPFADLKLACVQALTGEEGLRAAEREFRKHDRRVHSLAKLRYETLVKQREARASAAELIKASAELLDAPLIPANRLVELKQAWELLPATLIEDQDHSRFAQLLEDLAVLMRERGERKRALSRWFDAARQALAALSSAQASVVAVGAGAQELAAMLVCSEAARATLAQVPASATVAEFANGGITELAVAIQSALQDAELIEARLAILDELQATQEPQQVMVRNLIERWKELPPMAVQRTESALNARLDELLQLHDAAYKKLQKQSSLIAKERGAAARQAGLQTLMSVADAAEAALASGQLAEASKQLATLQAAADKGGVGIELQTRTSALQSELLRLKGWQQWGGGRARDDLVLEAEALAATTVIAEGVPPPKLPVKQIESSIVQLRARWKELDRLGGATSKSLWLRFDTALKTAHLPVAAHLAQLKEARQLNLDARKNLLNALDALSIVADEHKSPDWKEVQRALAHFQTEWRKLGPLEHTVPHKAQAALLERMKASITRLEEPLKEVQLGAQTGREQLIVRAKALGQGVSGRDTMAKLRELQSQWQSLAKSQPLPRKTENKLWAEFKAASDAFISQREAAFSARDAELKANQAMRAALIARLEELQQDTPTEDIQRVLASVDMEWRKAGEVPKNQADKLESMYRTAREQAQQHIAGSARRIWQLTCDALLAKLALCVELESATPSADIEARWKILPALPARWEQALQARYQSGSEKLGSGKQTNSGEQANLLLLQLESALEIPTPAAFQDARQKLKLMAMKNALEGRKQAAPAWADIEKMAADVVGCTYLSPDQHRRLQSVIAALRKLNPALPR